MKRFAPYLILALALLLTSVPQSAHQQASEYFPPPGDWERRAPADLGMDEALLDEAIDFAKSQETDRPRDYSDQAEIFGRPLGPLPKSRGGTNGLILRHGYIVAEFGDIESAEPTYSAAKSFLSTLLGVAVDRGLIPNIDDPVRMLVRDGGYEPPHNSKITWRQHAQQTSEWEGEMFGKSHTFVGVEEFGRGRREPRELKEPGEFYEYNDVRINRFSLSLLRVWKQPLPEVLKERVLGPIGASYNWRYLPYNNSTVQVAGRKLKSVSGGTRWGGGLWISTLDEARFGYLFLRRGRWGSRQVISEKWVREATSPSPLGPDYGLLWWLNTRQKQWPDAPPSSYAAIGFGSNTIWVDPQHDLVVVWRWHKDKSANEFYQRILSSIRE